LRIVQLSTRVDAIDRTLLRDNLKLSVEDRLRQLMARQQFAEELHKAGRARHGS